MWRLLQRGVRGNQHGVQGDQGGDQEQQEQQEPQTGRFVSESEEESFDYKKYTYVEEFAGNFEMRVYNIEYDRMLIIPAVCPGGSKEEDIQYGFVYYILENGSWSMKVKRQRNRENPEQKWKFFMELNEEDVASAWTRRMDIFYQKAMWRRDSTLMSSWR